MLIAFCKLCQKALCTQYRCIICQTELDILARRDGVKYHQVLLISSVFGRYCNRRGVRWITTGKTTNPSLLSLFRLWVYGWHHRVSCKLLFLKWVTAFEEMYRKLQFYMFGDLNQGTLSQDTDHCSFHLDLLPLKTYSLSVLSCFPLKWWCQIPFSIR